MNLRYNMKVLVSTVSGSLVGLALSQSLILTGMVQHGMRQVADVVSQITSVERIVDYIKIDKEGNDTVTTGLLDLLRCYLLLYIKRRYCRKRTSR